MLIHRCLLLTLFVLITQDLIAQKKVNDTTYVSAAVSNLKKRYYEERKSESLINTGSDYSDYKAIADEHPFFLSDDWIAGDVRYNDNTYNGVPLQFDIHSQKLITEHAATGKRLELVSQFVSWFRLQNHFFIFLSDRQTHAKSSEGYYELLVDGSVKLLTRHSKAFQESTTTGKLEVRVEETQKYFIYKNDALIPVKGKSTLLSILADKRATLAPEIKRKRINFNRDKQQAMMEAVELYNSLPVL